MSDDHLIATRSDRGFLRLPAIPSLYGGHVEVYESSGAESPRVWLRAVAPTNLNEPDSAKVEAPIHLTVEAAAQLAQQLLFLVEHHYQTCDYEKREAALVATPTPEGDDTNDHQSA